MVTSYELYANSTSEITQILLHFDQAVAVNGTTNLEADKFMVCCLDNLEECDQVRQGAMSSYTLYLLCTSCPMARGGRGCRAGWCWSSRSGSTLAPRCWWVDNNISTYLHISRYIYTRCAGAGGCGAWPTCGWRPPALRRRRVRCTARTSTASPWRPSSSSSSSLIVRAFISLLKIPAQQCRYMFGAS